MAKAAYMHRGEALDYFNESETETLAAMDIVDFGTGIGVVGTTVIPPGKVGSLHVTGVFEIPKAAGEIAFGQALYYDAGAGTVFTSAGTPCGYAARAAADGDETVWVRLDWGGAPAPEPEPET